MAPIPKQHGAWAWMFVPMAIAFIARWPIPPFGALVLIVAVLSAYLLQNAVQIRVRRGAAGVEMRWILIYGAAAVASGLALFPFGDPLHLAALAVGPSALFMVVLVASKRSKRPMRGVVAEVFAIISLSLTSVAAEWLVDGYVRPGAAVIAGACVLYFISGVAHLRQRVRAAHPKAGALGPIVAPNLAWHVFVALALWYAVRGWDTSTAALTVIAFAPAWIRNVVAGLRPTRAKPNLIRLGFMEVGFSLWFTACLGAGMHQLWSWLPRDTLWRPVYTIFGG